ncbi:hypothetical protein KKG29_05325 [Patescibacteria group bacterium]|nr:hypothetical protein [Patescibacteria group bacterium]
MQNILLSVEVFASILVECHRGMGKWETGGIMIGPKQHTNIITDIIPSTSFAERRPSIYYQSEKDVQLLNQQLKQYHSNEYDFKGCFHKHRGMKELSTGDLHTCSNILQSPRYKINNHLIMLIVTETSIPPIFSYIVSLGHRKDVVVKEANIKLLPKACIEICAECFQPSNKEAYRENPVHKPSTKGSKSKAKHCLIRSREKQSDDNKLCQPKERT